MRLIWLLALAACGRTSDAPPAPPSAPPVATPARDAATVADAATPDAAVALAVDAGVDVDAPPAVAFDLADVKARLAACPERRALEPIGELTRAEAIGHRPVTEAAHLFGAKARAYVFFRKGDCTIVPVVGKAAAVTKGDFGGGGTVAYVVREPSCWKDRCDTVVSIKTADDRLVDAVPVMGCVAGSDLDPVRLRERHDSLRLGCWNSGGADRDRTDILLDYDDRSLAQLIEAPAGVAWIQVGMTELGQTEYDDTRTGGWCVARPPGGIAVVTVGPAPVIDVSALATPEEAAAAGVERMSGSCEQTVATRRHAFDPAKRQFVPVPGKPRVALARNICTCPKR